MQRYVAVGEAFRLPRGVEGIAAHTAAVNREENALALRILRKTHVVAQPAFHPTALVVIRTGTFPGIFVAVLEAVDIKLPHVVADAVEVFDKLAVRHADAPFK